MNTTINITEIREETKCESCAEGGIDTPATTHSTNPDFSGYALCDKCADEYNNQKPIDEYRDEEEDADAN